MKKYKFVFVLVVLFAISLVSLAQMTDQGENECFEGGLLDGQCSNTDVNGDGVVDQSDIDWMYQCGSYLAQADDDLIGRDDIPLDGCELPEREIRRPEKGSPYVPKPKAIISPCSPALDGLQSVPCCSPALDYPAVIQNC